MSHVNRFGCRVVLGIVAVVSLTAAAGNAVEVAYVVRDAFAETIDDLENLGDILVAEFLEDRGYELVFVSQEEDLATTLEASDAADLTIIAESVGSASVSNELNETTTPVITTESFLYDDMFFVEVADGPHADGLTDITIIDASHPLAAGLPLGDVAILDGPGFIGWGQDVEGDVTVIATMVDDPTQATLFVYEQGAELFDGSMVPGMRIGLPHNGLTLEPFPEWTDAGKALFAAAVDYALGIGGGVLGDFDASGVLDVADIDDLTVQSAGGTNPPEYDLNSDSLVDDGDIKVWIEDLFNSWIGDTDLDGEFNTNDLVIVLASGTYEQDVASAWSLGDFDGNGRTNTSDLVAALAGGGYENGPRAAVAAVPEPSSLALILIGALAAIGSSRRRK